jgi:F420-non-reducing hydrogenase large subunit
MGNSPYGSKTLPKTKPVTQKISIDPITRLEGHGRIDLFLNEQGGLDNAYMIIPELRGFEKFCEGRPVEEMPRIHAAHLRCAHAHHHCCAAKAATVIMWSHRLGGKELLYMVLLVADHSTHFISWADRFVVGPGTKEERNILGVVRKVGREVGAQVMRLIGENHEICKIVGGRFIHPVGALVGGMSKPITEDERVRIEQIARNSIETAKFSLKLFNDMVLGNKQIPTDPERCLTHRPITWGWWTRTTRSISTTVKYAWWTRAARN